MLAEVISGTVQWGKWSDDNFRIGVSPKIKGVAIVHSKKTGHPDTAYVRTWR